MGKFNIIETKNLYLRPFSLDDVNIVFSMSQEEGMKKWIPDQVYKDENETREVLEFLISQYSGTIDPSEAPFVIGVEEKETSELIGHVGLSEVDEGIEIGYAIAEGEQGKGYATEAVKAMTYWALTSLEISSIWGIVDINNEKSIRVLEKSGYSYVKEDAIKKKYIIKGQEKIPI